MPSAPKSPGERRDEVLVALVALLSSVAGLLNDFVYDDVPLIAENARVHGLGRLGELLTSPYWPPPFVENLYRPITMLELSLEYTLGAGAPFVFHLVSTLLYIAASVAVFRLASKILPHGSALAAGVLFAAHPVHVEAVALGVNQAELIVGIAACTMVALYLRWRARGPLNPATWTVLTSLVAVAALAKETGYVLPALIVFGELLLVNERPSRASMTRLLEGAGSFAAALFFLLLWRSSVLSGRVGGATPNEAIAGLGLGARALLMLQVVPTWGRLLVWPLHLQADYPPTDFRLPPSFGTAEMGAVLLLIAAVAIAIAARRRAPVVTFGIAWCAIALLPVSNIVPTGIVLAERTLFLPSIGFVLAAAGAGAWLLESSAATSPRARRAMIAATALLVALGVTRSVSRLLVWNSAHVVVRPSARN